MAEHWWRAYDGSIDHPKLLRLSDAMHRAWFTLQCIASANGGVLPAASDVALRLRVKPSKVAEWITILVAGGLLDRDGETYRPHNWNERQYKTDTADPTAASRSKRYRDRKRDDRDAAVTVKRPDTEADTEAEKKEAREVALWSAFSAFWDTWPNKVGKPAAMKAYSGALKRGAAPGDILNGVQAYVREKPPDRPWLNPATFLNQNRWEDQPAAVGTTNGKSGEISSACDRLIDKLSAGFGAPAPQEHPSGRAHETDARLLAYRGS